MQKSDYRNVFREIVRERGFFSLPDAMDAVRHMGIRSTQEYKRRYREEHRLPSSPDQHYRADWARIGAWTGFLGRRPRAYFSTIAEAMAEVQRLRIRSRREYFRRYFENPALPSNPNRCYASDWVRIGQWRGFLGKEIRPPRVLFATVEEAMSEVRRLGIRGHQDYRHRYLESPGLPSDPHRTYAADWDRIGRYDGFFGKPIRPPRAFFATIEEAMAEVQRLGIRGRNDYQVRYQESRGLPSSPHRYFASDWERVGRWIGFLGKG